MADSLRDLADRRFDLLVVGGGIYGAWAAYQAALLGLNTALIEQNDWGSGTSSASSKLIHGGLRYLEQGRLRLVRKALRERGELLKGGPHRFRTLRFGVPVEKGRGPGLWKLRTGLWLYDRLAGGKDAGLKRETVAAGQAALRWPFLKNECRSAAAVYGDVQTDDARLVFELVAGARAAGAVAARDVKAVRPVAESQGRLAAVRVEAGGEEFEIRTRAAIWAVGPWLGAEWGGKEVRRTRGVHLVMPALPASEAFLLRAPQDERVFFLIPWYGRMLLGTTDTDWRGDPSRVSAEPADVGYLLRAANHHLAESWTESDIAGAMAGVRVMREVPGAAPSSLSREFQCLEPMPGLQVPVGGKLTSARVDAMGMIQQVMRQLGKKPPLNPDLGLPLPWTPPEPWEVWLAEQTRTASRFGLDAAAVEQLARRYGSEVGKIWKRLEQFPQQAERLHPSHSFLMAELHHAFAADDAWHLDDALRRRLPLALLEKPGSWMEKVIECFREIFPDASPARLEEERRRLTAANGLASLSR